MNAFSNPNRETAIPRNSILSIAQAEEMNLRDIWVVITANHADCGNVMFQVTTRSGALLPIKLPYTFVAINLTEQASADVILSSEAFRRAISRGFITMVTAEYAAEVNSDPGARVELESVALGVSVGVSESVSTITGEGNSLANSSLGVNSGRVDSIVQAGLKQDPDLSVNPRIVQIMRNDRTSASEKVNLLRNHKSIIKPVDAYYIRAVASIDMDEDADLLSAAVGKMLSHFKRTHTKEQLTEARKSAKQQTTS